MRQYLDDMRALARPLRTPADLDPLLERIGDARFVLIGEASHGTSEYYQWRAEITRRLVVERGFSAVAVEGDWPDCFRVSCSVTGASAEAPRSALSAFTRWPTWMWANEEVAGFCSWLHGVNARRSAEERVAFYGLDVYSLWDSLRGVLGYLKERRPEDVDAALEAIRCFEPYAEDPQRYATATRLVPQSCEDEVSALLCDVREEAAAVSGKTPDDEFAARQNAEVAAGAERYYRAMVRGGPSSWNIRDTHMADTLDRIASYRSRDGRAAKVAVWEHNTHVGDARATDMADRGLVNVGQLVRERHGTDDVVLVGFGSSAGTVLAGSSWGAPVQVMTSPPARAGSLEALLHEAVEGDALFVHPPVSDQPDWLRDVLDHRAIGVVYRPEAETWGGNAVPTVLGERYDAFLYLDRTTALHALPTRAEGHEAEAYPTGL